MGPRKYYLDWLRVIAFGLLILFHVGCLYASWSYNLKSPRLYPDVDWLLLAVGPWRMPLLFLISGVASRYLIDRLGSGGFAVERLRRILPALLIGMFVVIPPQTYVFLLDRGVMHQDYLHFWIFSYLPADQTLIAPFHRTMPTYDHLWFIVYLLFYALFLALLTSLGRGLRFVAGAKPVSARANRIPVSAIAIAIAALLVVSTYAMERIWPQTFWVGNDWGAHLRFGGMFALGALVASHERFWDFVRAARGRLLAGALVFVVLQSINRAYWLTGTADPLWSAILWSVASGLFAACMVGAVSGYAARYLNHSSATLRFFNEAILPIYILHQPILLIAAYIVFPRHWPIEIEVAALTAITAFGSLTLYVVLIRPFTIMRVLFGLKPRPRQREAAPAVA